MARLSGYKIIDCHIHCGKRFRDLIYEKIEILLREARIDAACMFPPVEEIYDRYNPLFEDDAEWQRRRFDANRYILDLAEHGKPVIPYYFVWNDFLVSELEKPYCGIKWHRHPNEPTYHYDDPKCREFIRLVIEKNLPIVLEESFENTLFFIRELAPNARIIIPHLGALNGSFEALERENIWAMENVYADTALADPLTIKHYIERYGSDRLFWGSDYPFGIPGSELKKIQSLGLSDATVEKVVRNNIVNLLKEIKR